MSGPGGLIGVSEWEIRNWMEEIIKESTLVNFPEITGVWIFETGIYSVPRRINCEVLENQGKREIPERLLKKHKIGEDDLYKSKDQITSDWSTAVLEAKRQ